MFDMDKTKQAYFTGELQFLRLLESEALNYCDSLSEILKLVLGKNICQKLTEIYTKALVIPVSCTGAERAFSTLNRIKTFYRTTMLQNRFSHLAILSINSDIEIAIDKILEKFAKSGYRKIKLF